MNARVGPLFRYVTQRSFVRCHSDTAAYNGMSRRRRRCPEARCGVNAAAAAYRSFCASVSVSLGRQPAVIAASSSQSGPPITRSPDTYPATLRVQLDGATLHAPFLVYHCGFTSAAVNSNRICSKPRLVSYVTRLNTTGCQLGVRGGGGKWDGRKSEMGDGLLLLMLAHLEDSFTGVNSK